MKYGFFGNLEVSSKTACSMLLANINKCQYDTLKNWKVGIESGKYGPMVEKARKERGEKLTPRPHQTQLLNKFFDAAHSNCKFVTNYRINLKFS